MSIIISQSAPGPITWAYGLTAQGINQATATPLVASRNIFTTVPQGACCILPAVGSPTEIVVVNRGANPLLVLPFFSWQIEGQAVNVGAFCNPNDSVIFMSGDPNNATPPLWYAR